ncbi:MAG: energy transducer TonB, partial [Candidatus Latescibacteria bacterium]|nr:energy transducer TonB [Candidatus Latescibacterota bacterium]
TPGGEPPPGPGHDIRSLGASADLASIAGEPVPVPDHLADPQTTLATQEQLKQGEISPIVTEETPSEKVGMGGTGGGGSGMSGAGGGPGSGGGGGGGDGPPGTWRYDTPPNPRRLITSVQPKSLRDIEGTVKFRLLIDEFGTVIDAIILESSGHRVLDDLAQEAVRKSTFNPATFRGRTVKAWITFGYGFKVAKR